MSEYVMKEYCQKKNVSDDCIYSCIGTDGHGRLHGAICCVIIVDGAIA